MLVKNFSQITLNEKRRKLLEILEHGLASIQPDVYLPKIFYRKGDYFFISERRIYLKDFDRLFLIGIGKGSARTCKFLEDLLLDRLEKGFVIDVIEEKFKKIQFTLGTHPLPSEANFQFAQKIKKFARGLKEKDLVLMVVYGGGSALLVSPEKISLKKYIEINKALLKSGADIYQVNTVRKHLDGMKGGGLAKLLSPAKVISLIASDVPGNDLSFIASGPTVEDYTTVEDAWNLIKEFGLESLLRKEDLIETVKKLDNVENLIILSNLTALNAIKEKAESFGLKTKFFSDRVQGEVSEVAGLFLEEFEKLSEGELLLSGGETTVNVKGSGKGGRNQELALWFLKLMIEKQIFNTLFLSIDSDGWDNTEHAGALVDKVVVEKVKELKLNIDRFLDNNDSFSFFQTVGSAIITDRLPTNVADLMILWKI